MPSFLDRETARLDTLIDTKRQLIDRLREKRTALISHTVTRGLPPDEAARAGLPVNPPLKDSGVEWIGEVPEHWDVMQIRLASTRAGRSVVNAPLRMRRLESEAVVGRGAYGSLPIAETRLRGIASRLHAA